MKNFVNVIFCTEREIRYLLVFLVSKGYMKNGKQIDYDGNKGWIKSKSQLLLPCNHSLVSLLEICLLSTKLFVPFIRLLIQEAFCNGPSPVHSSHSIW